MRGAGGQQPWLHSLEVHLGVDSVLDCYYFVRFSSISCCAWQMAKDKPTTQRVQRALYPFSSWLSGGFMCLWNVNPQGWNPSWLLLRATRASYDGEQRNAAFLPLKYKGSIQRTHGHSTKSHSWVRSGKETGPSAKAIFRFMFCFLSKSETQGRATGKRGQTPLKVKHFFNSGSDSAGLQCSLGIHPFHKHPLGGSDAGCWRAASILRDFGCCLPKFNSRHHENYQETWGQVKEQEDKYIYLFQSLAWSDFAWPTSMPHDRYLQTINMCLAPWAIFLNRTLRNCHDLCS